MRKILTAFFLLHTSVVQASDTTAWKQLAPFPFSAAYQYAVGDHGLILAIVSDPQYQANDLLYRSTDYGRTWSRQELFSSTSASVNTLRIEGNQCLIAARSGLAEYSSDE